MMKTKIFTLITLFLISIGASAQIDRTQQPKPGPAPKISLDAPSEFTMSNGLTVMVVENHKLPRVSYSLQLDNAPITEGDKAGTSSLLSAMLGNGTTNMSKDAFNEEIDFLGARLNFGSQSASASSLSKYSERILELMADAAKNPLLTEEEFQKEKDKLIEGLKTEEKSVDAVAGRLGGALSYGKNHPYGEFVTEETVNNISLADVKAFYNKYFVPNNAYLVVVGDVDFKDVKKQVKKYFGDWKKSSDLEITVPNAKNNVQYTQINFVDMPNAVQSNISLTNNVGLKMNHPDYHAVLIANKILGGGFNSYLNMNLREEHGYTYGARSSIGTDKYASRFTAGASVRNVVTDSAVVETLKEINKIKTEFVTPEELSNAKAKYVGDFVLALERPSTVARYALNIKTNNLPEDFYSTYLEKINAVTAEDVKRVANTYFKPENARFIVVGKGVDVIPNLEKTGIPIKYFDKYGNETEKPEFKKPIPEGVTAQTVLDNYIKALGGKEALSNISTITQTMEASFQGQQMTSTVKFKAPNMFAYDVSMMGMTAFKQAFNGESGYIMQMGSKQDMPEDMLSELKDKKNYVDELDMLNSDNKVSLTGIENVDGKDAYAITVESPKGDKSVLYYDVETGLKVQESKTVKAPTGQEVTQNTNFGDYKEVNGIMFPHMMSTPMGPQKIEFKVTSVAVNEDLSAEDFN